MQLLIIVKRIK